MQDPASFFVSDNDGGIASDVPSLSGTTLSTPIVLRSSSSKIYAVSFRNNEPVYVELNNITDGSTTTRNFNTDFKPFDHTISYDFPGAAGYSVSYYGINNPGNTSDPSSLVGYIHSLRWWYGYGPNIRPIKLGYNDGFDLYRSSFSITYGRVWKDYEKLGTPATSAPLLNYTFDNINDNCRDFTFLVSGKYHLRTSRWIGGVNDKPDGVEWIVNSSPGARQLFPNIPDDIVNRYPSFALSSLQHSGSKFTVYLDDFSFDDYINSTMNISSSKKTSSTEYQSITFF
jgi:hypothetical protein